MITFDGSLRAAKDWAESLLREDGGVIPLIKALREAYHQGSTAREAELTERINSLSQRIAHVSDQRSMLSSAIEELRTENAELRTENELLREVLRRTLK